MNDLPLHGLNTDDGLKPYLGPVVSMPDFSDLRVAIVHDWFVTYAGSERVVEQLLKVFPHADLFALVDFLPDAERGFLGGRRPKTSFIQNLPGARTGFRSYLPLMPLAVEQFDVSAYDLVISSSHAVAKGVITGPSQVHVSYVHTPIRYAWDLQHQYLREAGLTGGVRSWVARLSLHYIRLWDTRTAHGVDTFVANSRFIARRIRKAYGRPAQVVYPPVDLARFPFRKSKEDFYLAASRMVPYKRMSLIAEAFVDMPHRQLVMIGDGPDLARVKRIARDAKNIRVLGHVTTEVLADHMGRAKAFVFAAEEDFGISTVEAQACGTPVIAYGAGGVLESVQSTGLGEAPTGIFFCEQTTDSLRRALDVFECSGPFDPNACRANAERFSAAKFRERIAEAVRAGIATAGRTTS